MIPTLRVKGAKLVWTEPAFPPDIAFATNLMLDVFKESTTRTALVDETKPDGMSHTILPVFPPPCTTSPAGTPSTHIPRPPNAFILFRAAFIHAGYVPASVEPSHASLSAIAGLTWRALPAAERTIWHRKAKEERERHRVCFPGYNFQPRRRTADVSENRGGSGTEIKEDRPRRRQREVPLADRKRQAHIASLLVAGLSGGALDEEIAKFDAERKGRGESGVQITFAVIETPEGRVATSNACEKTMKKSTKRQTRDNKDVKRRRGIDSPSLSLPPSSLFTPSSSLPATPTNAEPMAPSAFTFDDPSLHASPVDNSRSPLFEWPYSFSPSMPSFSASSLASFSPCDRMASPFPFQLDPTYSALLQPSDLGLWLGLGLGGMDMGAGTEYLMSTGSWDGLIPSL
ncbi:hypothetical protein B0H13DRAFT_2310638 [Mycena leptocephala]|nr:hypothetical protein B0H13DRAFT_2310638 [Mycena leptocephala]